MAEHRSRLLYLDAGDINDDRADLDGLNVLDPAGNKLGDLDGFIVEASSGRPFYAVVDSGGWFSSRRYLLPIGHARLDTGNQALRVDLDRPTIERFPEFDEGQFAEMSEEAGRRFTERTLTACCATELQSRTGPDRYDYDKWSHYAQPDWWQSRWYSGGPETRMAGRAPTSGHATYDVPPVAPVHPRQEAVIAHDRDLVRDRDLDRDRVADRPTTERDAREAAIDRAQPGDVLGIENEGETTSLGDTASDERDRREDAEKAAPPLRPEDRKR